MLIPSDGGAQDMITLDLRYLPGLLLGVEVSLVRAELGPRLKEIKDELYDALAAYTFEGVAVNPAFGVLQQNAGAPALSPSPPSLPQIRADLHKFIGSAVEAENADEARRAWAALDALLPAPSRTAQKPKRLLFPDDTTKRGPRAGRWKASLGLREESPLDAAEPVAAPSPAPEGAGQGLRERILWILNANRLTARELSRRSGLSETALSAALKALKKDPQGIVLRTVEAIAHGAAVSLAWLASGVGSPYPSEPADAKPPSSSGAPSPASPDDQEDPPIGPSSLRSAASHEGFEGPKDPAFARRIEMILDRRGWSLNQLGEAAGIGSGPISKLRQRGPAARATTLAKVARAAGVELRWLATGEGAMTSEALN
jgi:transcriptional regulator with XRE-family HTH domain